MSDWFFIKDKDNKVVTAIQKSRINIVEQDQTNPKNCAIHIGGTVIVMVNTNVEGVLTEIENS